MLARHWERTRIDGLITSIRDGHSSTLLLAGGAGVGKSTLLDYLAKQADGMQVLSVTGVQSEVELVHAALHQLCRPLVDAMGLLPAPQREALEITFGQRSGPVPSPFLVGLATLGLLSEASRAGPIVWIVDDAQWLDEASARALGFVARRLDVESVGIVFALRTPNDGAAFDGVPSVIVQGLGRQDAEMLLSSLTPGPIDPRAMDRILEEADGNPLAIVEATRTLSPAELSTGIILTDSANPSRLEEQYGVRLHLLPDETQQLLLVAAAEPSAEPRIILAAAAALGVRPDAVEPAVEAGLCMSEAPIRFIHPLVRSAVYRTAAPEALRAVHAALAGVDADEADPDLNAWHRARAVDGTDENAASALADAAGRMQARGGNAAAAALYRQAVEISSDEHRRSAWLLRISQAELAAGQYDLASRDIAAAFSDQLHASLRAEATLTAARVAFVRERSGAAVALLLDAAEQLSSVSVHASREAYFEAFSAAMFGASLATTDVTQVAERWLASGVKPGDRPAHLLLDAMTRVITEGTPAARRKMQEVVVAFRREVPDERTHLHWLWHATIASLAAWDYDTWDAVSSRHLLLARAAGDYNELPIALTTRAYAHLFRGEFPAALDAVQELAAITSATGGRMNPSTEVGSAALQGRDEELDALVRWTTADAQERADGSAVAIAYWGAAVLDNSRRRYETALGWAWRARTMHNPLHSATNWALVEYIEAASRLENVDASEELAQLEAVTVPYDTAWGLGIYHRSRALLSADREAEEHYRESRRLLSLSPGRLDFARATLVYGEWLRRQRRLKDARAYLQEAHQLFAAMGASGFADRAAHELRAAGATPRSKGAGAAVGLTPQETQIAQLAAQGLTNSEVATRMFLSPRTVEYHLTRVFSKLNITSRHQLVAASADS